MREKHVQYIYGYEVEKLKMLKLDLNNLQNQKSYKELKKKNVEQRVKHEISNFTISVSVHTCFQALKMLNKVTGMYYKHLHTRV